MIQSAGVIVIDKTPDGPKALCVRAYANWDFPKGTLDTNESHQMAALRELEEETTLTVDDVSLSGLKAPTITYGSGSKKKQATYFLAERTSNKKPFLPISPELGKPENDEYRWVLIDDLLELMPKRLIPIVQFVQVQFR
jgi:8-oxo-dGTP pyrophosphatase MutT (NUDIX family)